MQDVKLYWSLIEMPLENTVKRNCKNCGKTVQFRDTLIRRHNANGKNIYRFAIYKCEKNHTWNEKLSIYKAFTNHVKVRDQRKEINTPINEMNVEINGLLEKEIFTIHITINGVEGNGFRLDKVLADRIASWSRSEIVRKIKDQSILINQEKCKPSQKLMLNDVITINL